MRLTWIPCASLILLLAGCESVGDSFCEQPGCLFTDAEWERISTLAHLPPPPRDPANKYVGNALAEQLGRKLYHDPRFSGVATQKDSTGRVMSQPARAPIGERIEVSCATCHDLRRGGTDPTSVPGHVSVGAGWYDVNAQSTINSAYYPLKYWNGRYDSLVWQAMAVGESSFSMNGNRVRFAWLLHDLYKDEYEAVFGDEWPLPEFGRSFEEQAALLETDGQCKLVGARCPTQLGCAEESDEDGNTTCWPRFPLEGKAGDGACKRGQAPFQDAYDCMAAEDQETVFRTFVNWAKAIAAFEHLLYSREAPFDRWYDDGPDSDLLPPEAIRGARLFVGKAACIECHSGPLMSDKRFYNIGVPQEGVGVPREEDCVDDGYCAPLGWYAGLTALKAGTTRRIDNEDYSDTPTDRSRKAFYELEVEDSMRGAWRTPGLRDVALTAPYMHDGIYRSLEEVVRHYDRGGTSEGVAPQNKSVRIAPLGLRDREVLDLLAFLEALTGDPLPTELTDPPELP